MRGLFASLVIAILFLVVALVAAAFGAVGVAFIGSLLHRWFDLSQWQGTLVALVVAVGLALLVYKVTQAPAEPAIFTDDWEEEPEPDEPPVVPWRRNRPTPGELPSSKPTTDKRSASSKPRK
jgi:hypothetical protein